jgi:TonB family protein
MRAMLVMLLVDAALKASVLLALAALLDRLLHGRLSAAARHVVWVAALGGALALAPLSQTVPGWRVPVPAHTLPAALVRVDAAGGAIATAASGVEPQQSTPAGPGIPWTAAALWVWAAGTLLVLARMAAGAWAIRRIARRGVAPCPKIAGLAARLARECGVRVEVVLIAGPAMPMTFGISRPRILLPAEAHSWPEGRLTAVLLHELAHVRRRDGLSHALAGLACALYWPNPLAWRALNRALALREHAADDFVLRFGARPSDYAGSLLEVARTLAAPRLCRGAAMARPSQLEGRLLAILDGAAERRAPSRRFSALTAAAAMAVALALAGLQPVLAQDAAQGEIDAALREFDFDRALGQSRDQIVAAERRYGSGSVQFARVLVRAGAALSAAGESDTAEQAFTRAVSILEVAAPNDPALAEALYRSGIQATPNDPARARALYERALAAAQRSGAAAVKARVLHILAVQEGDPARAGKNLQEAIAIETRIDNPLALAATLEAYVRVLREEGRTAEAQAAADRARAARAQDLARRPAPPPRPEGVFRVGGGVTAPNLLSKQEPFYSAEARAAKLQGTVVLYVEIGEDGIARNIRVTRPMGFGLDQEAVRAVRRWRFKPGVREGQPVVVAATIEVNFRLL